MEINATFLGQAVAFLIFAVVCMKYIWPPLMNAIDKRQKEIADGLTQITDRCIPCITLLGIHYELPSAVIITLSIRVHKERRDR